VRERLWVVAPPADGLRETHPVPFADLAGRPFVLPTAGHGLRILIENAAREAGAELVGSVQTNSMAVQKQLALAGHGWTVLPAAGIAEDVAAGILSAAPAGEPGIWRDIALAMPRAGRVPPAVEVVARELARQIGLAVREGRWPSAELLTPNED
jgi:DNA-binding transcriptional LysR family regulator